MRQYKYEDSVMCQLLSNLQKTWAYSDWYSRPLIFIPFIAMLVIAIPICLFLDAIVATFTLFGGTI
jgi:hypothetical protein